jgi:3-hydroxyisobutyrate dehydrogenase
MGYYTTMAEDLGAAHATAQAIRETYDMANQVGPKDATVPELVTILQTPNRTSK